MGNVLKSWAIRQALDNSKRTIILALIITGIIGSGVRFIFVDDNVMNMLPKDIESRRIWDDIIEELFLEISTDKVTGEFLKGYITHVLDDGTKTAVFVEL